MVPYSRQTGQCDLARIFIAVTCSEKLAQDDVEHVDLHLKLLVTDGKTRCSSRCRCAGEVIVILRCS